MKPAFGDRKWLKKRFDLFDSREVSNTATASRGASIEEIHCLGKYLQTWISTLNCEHLGTYREPPLATLERAGTPSWPLHANANDLQF